MQEFKCVYFSTNNFVPQYAELQTYMTVYNTLVLIILFLNVGTQLYYTLVMQTYIRTYVYTSSICRNANIYTYMYVLEYCSSMQECFSTNNFVPQYAEMQTHILMILLLDAIMLQFCSSICRSFSTNNIVPQYTGMLHQ